MWYFRKNKLSLNQCFPFRFSNRYSMYICNTYKKPDRGICKFGLLVQKRLTFLSSKWAMWRYFTGGWGWFILLPCGVLCEDEHRWGKGPKLQILSFKSRWKHTMVIEWLRSLNQGKPFLLLFSWGGMEDVEVLSWVQDHDEIGQKQGIK